MVSIEEEPAAGTGAALDYSKFKTPYFKIGIGLPGASPKDIIDLPPHLHRLVQKVEINELLQCGHNTLTMSFTEGSREPYSPSAGTKADMYEGGDFSNHSGFVSDLKFTGDGGGGVGFGSLSAAADSVDSALSASAPGGTENPETEELEDFPKSDTTQTENIAYLLAPGARLRVTWGYLEDVANRRVIIADIFVVRTNFPANGQAVTEVVAKGATHSLDLLTPKKAKNFKTTDIAPLGFPVGAGTVADNKDKTISEVLDELETYGLDIIRSAEYSANVEDTGRNKVWAAGKSFHQFMNELAKKHNAYYTAYYNVTTGKPTLIFIKQEELDASATLAPNLMTYKGPGSIIKSVNVTANFGNIKGTSYSGVSNKKGNPIVGTSNAAKAVVASTLFEGQTIIDSDPSQGTTATEAGKAVAQIAENNAVGHVIYHPSQNQQHLLDMATNKSYGCGKALLLDFSTIGFTRIKPGGAPFRGLGERFSGNYSIIAVTHSITSSGYVCTGQAKGSAMGKGGVQIPPKKTSSVLDKGKVSSQLFDKLSQGIGE